MFEDEDLQFKKLVVAMIQIACMSMYAEGFLVGIKSPSVTEKELEDSANAAYKEVLSAIKEIIPELIEKHIFRRRIENDY